MKKILFTLSLSVCTLLAFGQIPVVKTKILTEAELKQATPYDSSKNYLASEVYGYMNEELFLPEKSEGNRQGWTDFVVDVTKNTRAKENIYEVNDSGERTSYDALANKVFKVVDIVQSIGQWNSDRIYFLELQAKGVKGKLYYAYNTHNENDFPFIAMKYYKRLKDEQVGQSYVFNNRFMKNKKDVKIGRNIPLASGDVWKCVDVCLEDQKYKLSLLLENQKGNTIVVDVDYAINQKNAYNIKDVEKYKESFGKTNWTKILNGEIELDFTPAMVRLSWGEPQRTNRSSDGDIWIYGNSYLYFEGGKLVSYN